jgi:hypothetical protein
VKEVALHSLVQRRLSRARLTENSHFLAFLDLKVYVDKFQLNLTEGHRLFPAEVPISDFDSKVGRLHNRNHVFLPFWQVHQVHQFVFLLTNLGPKGGFGRQGQLQH